MVVSTPPLATSTSTPPSLVHKAFGWKAPLLVITSKSSAFSVAVPLKPVKVTLEPAERATFETIFRKRVLGADAT
jgi:hypothetical protein